VRNPFPEAGILVVDDQPANVALLARLLQHWGYRNVSSTTESGRVLGLCEASEPDLVLLDLHMPKLDGFEVLAQLRPWLDANPPLPVLVITADTTSDACEQALSAGARDFITKPFNASEVGLRVASQLETRRAQIELNRHADTLEMRVKERTRELEQTNLDVIERLSLAAEYRDDDTQEHARRVGRTSALLAETLGAPASEVELIRIAAPLHDIGKIGISDVILLNPTGLTADERLLVNEHTTMGHDILTGSSSELLSIAALIALTHHERWDGTGYPNGLFGEAIPIAGRIVAVADVFDALTHMRPYKTAWPTVEAVAELERASGSQFDPRVVTAFLTLDHEALLAPVPVERPEGSHDDLLPRTAGRMPRAGVVPTRAAPPAPRQPLVHGASAARRPRALKS
jgi:putative two-component system response regulator